MGYNGPPPGSPQAGIVPPSLPGHHCRGASSAAATTASKPRKSWAATQQQRHSSVPGDGLIACLTIQQPWASLIVTSTVELPRGFGYVQKRVENRTWSTTHRGPMIIHAGKTIRQSSGVYWDRTLPLGACLGVAELVTCLDLAYLRESKVENTDLAWVVDHMWSEGPICWVLDNIRQFKVPVSLSGQQGLFYVPCNLFPELNGSLFPPIATTTTVATPPDGSRRIDFRDDA